MATWFDGAELKVYWAAINLRWETGPASFIDDTAETWLAGDQEGPLLKCFGDVPWQSENGLGKY